MTQRRRFILALAVAAAGLGLSAPALADCGSDMQKLAADRNVELQKINEFAKASHGKPLDPTQFCVRSAGLLRAEGALIAYMEKNKDWCSFPDDAITNLKTSHAKNAGIQRQGLHGRREDQENEGAGRAGRRWRAAGSTAAGRAALTAEPRGSAVLPDARPASLVLSLTPDFALPFVQLARLDRPDRLAIAAGAVLAVDSAGGARASSRAQSLASRALPGRRDRDARRGLDL